MGVAQAWEVFGTPLLRYATDSTQRFLHKP